MWYKKRPICFTCTGCGACCKREEGEVYITQKELKAIERYLKKQERPFPAMYMKKESDEIWSIEIGPQGACPFLDSENRCSIQPVKPWQCSAYPFWPEVMQSEFAWEEEARFCEGMNQGEVHSAEEIEEEMKGDPFLE